jgi:hypothetical protein
MSPHTVFLKQDLSIKQMLRLADHDNILISSRSTLRICHEILLRRLEGTPNGKTRQAPIEVYVRPHLLGSHASQYLRYLQKSRKMVLWTDQTTALHDSPTANAGQLTLIHSEPSNPIRQEGFLVTRMPETSETSRILVVWKNDGIAVEGVLVTNPQVVDDVVNRLEMVICSDTADCG